MPGGVAGLRAARAAAQDIDGALLGLIERSGLPALHQRAAVQEGVRLLRAGDAQRAVAAFSTHLAHVASQRLHVLDLHVCLSNRSAAYLAAGQPEEALQDALAALECIEDTAPGVPVRQRHGYATAMRRLGDSLLALGLPLLAQDAFEEGLQADAMHTGLRSGLQAALQSLHITALSAAPARCPGQAAADRARRAGASPHDALVELSTLAATGEVMLIQPNHRLLSLAAKHLPDMPLLHQLTPKRAEVDVATRDTLNYVTSHCDVAMPRHLLDGYLPDPVRMAAVARAIRAAVLDITVSRGLECRALILGSAMGVLPLMALQAGATHVMVVDRWMYVAIACQQLLQHHGVPGEQWDVRHGRITDMQLGRDIRSCANLVVADTLLDDGLLTAGLSPCLRHALAHFVTQDAVVIPRAVDVWVQGVESASSSVRGVNLAALDMLRCGAGIAGCPLSLSPATSAALTAPCRAWSWDCADMPTDPGARALALTVTAAGRVTTLMSWLHVTLYPGIAWRSCGAPLEAGKGTPVAHTIRAIQHRLPSHVAVQPGATLKVIALHNTARLGFVCAPELENFVPWLPEDPSLVCDDVSTPLFALWAAPARWEATAVALQRVIHEMVADSGTAVHALVLNGGAGPLPVLAAQAGAASVLCVEAHPALVLAARRVAALNGVSDRVCVVHGQVRDVVRGVHTPRDGCNLLVVDITDPTLFSDGTMAAACAAVGAGLIARDARVVPDAATLHCCGLEVLSRHPAGAASAGSAESGGATGAPVDAPACSDTPARDPLYLDAIDLAPLNKFRWTEVPTVMMAERLDTLPHKIVTGPIPLWRWDLAALVTGQGATAVRPVEWMTRGVQSAGTHGGTPPLETAAAALPDEFVKPGKGGGLMIQAAARLSGVLNAVQLWVQIVLPGKRASAPSTITMADVMPPSPPCQPACSSAGALPGGFLALAYTRHVAAVAPAQAVQMVAMRQPGLCGVVVDVRPSRGSPAPRPPWKEEWGGGSSIENPHVQRIKYCELLESDLMQRLPSGRGPSAERDVKDLARHCGALHLHAPCVSDCLRHLALMERLYRPGSTAEPEEASDGPSSVLGRWQVAVCAAREHGSSPRVRLPPDVQPHVDWKQLQGLPWHL